jgi:hypothetical protein
MVSGFLISPNDHDRIRSGLAIEILIERFGGAYLAKDVHQFIH